MKRVYQSAPLLHVWGIHQTCDRRITTPLFSWFLQTLTGRALQFISMAACNTLFSCSPQQEKVGGPPDYNHLMAAQSQNPELFAGECGRVVSGTFSHLLIFHSSCSAVECEDFCAAVHAVLVRRDVMCSTDPENCVRVAPWVIQ
jgi:hypothetical protein